MRIWCEIEGMLSDRVPGERRAVRVPVPRRIQILKELIGHGHYVVLWSARGDHVAQDFAKKHKLQPALCLGGPEVFFGRGPTKQRGVARAVGPMEMEQYVRKEGLLK